jgi:ABC-type transport system involved in cytochrome bd biosynthesis fused ATPase/permease subunit
VTTRKEWVGESGQPPGAAPIATCHDPQGAISLDNVSFAYPGGPDVLHAVSLEIQPGELVAIVGASGSGRSTLLRRLLGFGSPRQGLVLSDGSLAPFFTRPISLAFAVVTIFTMLLYIPAFKAAVRRVTGGVASGLKALNPRRT